MRFDRSFTVIIHISCLDFGDDARTGGDDLTAAEDEKEKKKCDSSLIRVEKCTSQPQTQALAGLTRCMMNGSALEMENTVMVTNKGRCQAGGARGGEGWDWSRPVNRSPTRGRNTGGGETGDDKEGQETDVMRDREVRMTDEVAAPRWTIDKSDQLAGEFLQREACKFFFWFVFSLTDVFHL